METPVCFDPKCWNKSSFVVLAGEENGFSKDLTVCQKCISFFSSDQKLLPIPEERVVRDLVENIGDILEVVGDFLRQNDPEKIRQGLFYQLEGYESLSDAYHKKFENLKGEGDFIELTKLHEEGKKLLDEILGSEMMQGYTRMFFCGPGRYQRGVGDPT